MSTWTVPSYGEGWRIPGYTEERELGDGASGRVVAGVHDGSGQPVAIKYLSPALANDPAFMWSFREEAEKLSTLNVPQVVRVFDFAEQPEQGAAIVTELVNGVSLQEMLLRQGPLSPESALAVLKNSLLGLAAVHRLGFGHRDVKPGNVLIGTRGEIKLTDVGVAMRVAKQMPAVGTPPYMAPELWHGAPDNPATDVYAATAVFVESLSGKAAFSGTLAQLREQHESVEVPLDRVDPPLRQIVADGMAKNPGRRPDRAIAFISEVEALAGYAYGPDWEDRGRAQLAERSAALVPVLLRQGSRNSSGKAAVDWDGSHRRRVVAIVSIAVAAVLLLGGGATAVLLKGQGSQAGSASQATSVAPTVQALANVTPPVAASKCTAPTAFAYSGTLSASAPGTVKYQWVYSSGKPGAVQTLAFTAAGHKTVTGQTVSSETAGSGWAELKVISPAAVTSAKASYKLICGDTGGVTATAAITPATRTTSCATTPAAFTAAGSITASKAETVTYYWAQSNGHDSAPATLTFTGAGTRAAAPLTIPSPKSSGSGEAVLVVTSPVAAASSPATYTLTCSTPKVTPTVATALSATAAVSPASQSLTSCTATAPTFAFSGSITDNQPGTVSYYWKLPSGNGATQTLSFAKAGTETVTGGTYTPASDRGTGTGTLVVTSPSAVSSNAASYTLTCGAALAVTNNAAATAVVGQQYSGTLTVSGGTGTYTWTATGLPNGLTATPNGATLTVSGLPTATGTSDIAVTVHDSATPEGTGSASLTLAVSEPALTLTTNFAGTGTVGQSYSGSATAAGGNGNYTLAATGLPAGLTASTSGATITISGTPSKAATSSVVITVSDNETTPATQTATVTIVISAAAAAPTITTTSLPSGVVGTAYTASVAATGGTGAFTWSASGLPAGLTINSSTGTISGTPTTATPSGTPAEVVLSVTSGGSTVTASAIAVTVAAAA
jgi:eukaryotic-like serine/threonine-protein kinase